MFHKSKFSLKLVDYISRQGFQITNSTTLGVGYDILLSVNRKSLNRLQQNVI